MKANELRIGNWIFDSSDEQKHFQIEQICKDSYSFKGYYIVFRNGSFKSKLDGGMIEPIPLTPEILEKCGAKQLGSEPIWVFKISQIEISVQTTNSKLFIDTPFGQICLPIIVIHLHQLQNLYFALTGKELIINLLNKTT